MESLSKWLVFLLGLVLGLILAGSAYYVPAATAIIPGWHTTIFPPTLVFGPLMTVLGGLQMVGVLAWLLSQKRLPYSVDRMEQVNWLILVAATLWAITYGFNLWLSGMSSETLAFLVLSKSGPYWSLPLFFLPVIMGAPQLLWWRRARRSLGWTLAICLLINLEQLFSFAALASEAIFRAVGR